MARREAVAAASIPTKFIARSRYGRGMDRGAPHCTRRRRPLPACRSVGRGLAWARVYNGQGRQDYEMKIAEAPPVKLRKK